MSENKHCYLCGHTSFNQRPGKLRDDPTLKVYECKSCGLVFLSSFDHISNGFYEDSQMHGGELLKVQDWLQEAEWDDERRFRYIKALLPKQSLLDFGCGAGGFLLKARTLAARVEGVELESRLQTHFQDSGLTVYKSVSEVPVSTRYDIITLFHVLEHQIDPKATLGTLSKNLAAGGQIIIEVPHADDALLTLYGSEAFSHFTYWKCHLFLFNVQTLRMLASKARLKVNYIKQIQRYPLSNHLYWLAKGKPGGHQRWHFLDTDELHAAYEKQLSAIGKCDTLIASFSQP